MRWLWIDIGPATEAPRANDEACSRELSARLESIGPDTSVPLHVLSSVSIDTRRALESALREFLALHDKISKESYGSLGYRLKNRPASGPNEPSGNRRRGKGGTGIPNRS